MFIVRLLGYLFLIAMIICLAILIALFVMGYDIRMPAGRIWFELHQPSLNLYQVIVQRTLRLPLLWDVIILPALLMPTWVVLSIKAGILAILSMICFRISHSPKRKKIRPL